MKPFDDPESDRTREGSSDATPGGVPEFRRPGELAFAVFLVLASAGLLFSAYDIAGFRALSSPGAIPMATTAAMLVTAALVLWKTARQPRTQDETLRVAVFPGTVLLMAVLLVGYALLLKPLGFIPASLIFLFIAIKLLSGRSLAFSAAVTIGSVIGIWLIFRIVFTVLMPAGIVPEAEIIQIFRNLFNGGA